MSKASLPGKLIAVEGPDGGGKTTFLERFCAALPGIKVTRSPGGTCYAEALRDLMLNAPAARSAPNLSHALTVIAGRLDLWKNVVEPALAAGHTVITDRWQWSTRIYGTFGMEYEAALETMAMLSDVEDFAGIPEPDLTFFVKAPLGVHQRRLAERGHADTFEAYGLDLIRRNYDLYHELAESSPNPVHIVNGVSESVDAEVTMAKEVAIRVLGLDT